MPDSFNCIRKINMPFPGHGCNDISVRYQEADLVVGFFYDGDKSNNVGEARFDWAKCFRFFGEYYGGPLLPGSYDQLLVFDQSPWLAEMRALTPEGKDFCKYHFAGFFSNCGFLEVVADNFEITSDEKDDPFSDEDRAPLPPVKP